MAHLLWIEDDPALRRIYRSTLEGEGYLLGEAGDPAQARAAVAKLAPELVLLDLMLPPSGKAGEGLSLLSWLRQTVPAAKIVVLSGAGNTATALEAVHRGAFDFLSKPIDPDVLLVVLERARTRAGLESELVRLRQQQAHAQPGQAMVGSSPPFRAAMDLADRVGPSDLPVLLLGERVPLRKLAAHPPAASQQDARRRLQLLHREDRPMSRSAGFLGPPPAG